MTRRRKLLLLIAAPLLVALGWYAWAWATYPTDRTPEGAYMRIVKAVNLDQPEGIFPYTETAAQHACFTIHNYRRKALEHVRRSYPEPERGRLVARYAQDAQANGGSDLFTLFARRRGWVARLRRDLSGIRRVDIQGERATVETVRGTRYPLRRRENGIWGLTLFTPTLVGEAEKAARDLALIEQSAKDYERARKAGDGR